MTNALPSHIAASRRGRKEKFREMGALARDCDGLKFDPRAKRQPREVAAEAQHNASFLRRTILVATLEHSGSFLTVFCRASFFSAQRKDCLEIQFSRMPSISKKKAYKAFQNAPNEQKSLNASLHTSW